MGRYYETNEGRGGKFMFGVQPSDDPGTMGMVEQEPTSIDYYADEDNVEEIRKNLNKQYDKLGVPLERRLYYYKDHKEYDDYEERELKDRVFIDVREDDPIEMEKYKDKTRWYCEKPGYVSFERGHERERTLALARIRLGVAILSDIKDSGECWLNAEI